MRGLEASTVYMEQPNGKVVPVDVGSLEEAWQEAETKEARVMAIVVLLWLTSVCGLIVGVTGLIAGWW